MLSFDSPKKIGFKYHKEVIKDIFDKAKKCDIINNNNSIFLNKALSSKKKTIINKILKKENSDFVPNYFDTKITFIRRKNKLVYSPNKFSIEINRTQNHSNPNIFNKRNISNKIYVNKNKNLGNNTKREKRNSNSLFNIDNYVNKNYNYNERLKNKTISKLNQNKNNNLNLNTEKDLNNLSLYNSKYIKKPSKNKFENSLSTSNIYNNSNIYNHTCNSYKNKNNSNNKNVEENKYQKRPYTELRIKRYVLYDKNKNNSKTELYRNYDDLEKKSLEISLRKRNKNLSTNMLDFKKNINLLDIKKSLDFLKKSKSKKKDDKEKDNKTKFINFNENNNNRTVINNIKLLNDNDKKDTILNSNKTNKINENDNNSYKIRKIIYKNNGWLEQRNVNYNSEIKNEEKKLNKKIFINNNQNSYNIIHLKNLYNSSKNKKEIEVEKSTPKNYKKIKNNNYDININDNNSKKIIEININNNEININKINKKTKTKEIFKNKKNKKGKHRSCNRTPLVTKRFIEDYRPNEFKTILSYNNSYSHFIVNNKNFEKKIKVNKRKAISKKKIQNILPPIIEEEKLENNIIKDKIIKLNILKVIQILKKLIEIRRINTLREIFKKFIIYSNESIKNNNIKIMSNIKLQSTNSKYFKKVITKNLRTIKDDNTTFIKKNSMEKIIEKNILNYEKQKIILLKRKELRAFERYEECKDFIDNFRLVLLKYLFKGRTNNK